MLRSLRFCCSFLAPTTWKKLTDPVETGRFARRASTARADIVSQGSCPTSVMIQVWTLARIRDGTHRGRTALRRTSRFRTSPPRISLPRISPIWIYPPRSYLFQISLIWTCPPRSSSFRIRSVRTSPPWISPHRTFQSPICCCRTCPASPEGAAMTTTPAPSATCMTAPAPARARNAS